MLGRLPAFRGLFGKRHSDEAIGESRELVQRALRPVLLRRTKAQVLPTCRRRSSRRFGASSARPTPRYDAAARTTAALLAGRRELDGKQERFVVLEALLRLRQAACHEGLLDPQRRLAESVPSSTRCCRASRSSPRKGTRRWCSRSSRRLLDLLEPQLRARGIDFERLDGSTTKRPAARRALPERSRSARCS
jgi:SNF2 family DNA or RNA helicase